MQMGGPAWPVTGVSGSGRLVKSVTCQASVAEPSLAVAGEAHLAAELRVAERVLRVRHRVAKTEEKIHGKIAGLFLGLVIGLGGDVERLRRGSSRRPSPELRQFEAQTSVRGFDASPQRTWDPNAAAYARPTLPDLPLVKTNMLRRPSYVL